MPEHLPVIDIPGLGDKKAWHGQKYFGSVLGRQPDFDVHYQRQNWSEGNYADKEVANLELVDRLYEEYEIPVAVVGHSAGGHPAARLLALRPDKISCVVMICAEIGHPENVAGTFEANPAFQQSLALVGDTKRRLAKEGRTAGVLSIRPWVDHRVPPEDAIVPGAENRLVKWCGPLPTIGHSFSIPLIYTLGVHHIADFIREHA